MSAAKEDFNHTKENFQSQYKNLEKDVYHLKNPPFFHACGFKHYASITSKIIDYNNIFYNSTNTEGGGLDMSTGIFTCPYPGSYTVTWSLLAQDNAGDKWVWIFLPKNGQNIDESFHRSDYTGSSGWVDNMGQYG